MKKKGFILLETIVVLMVVTLSLSILLASYSLITRKTNEKLYYDKTSDIYLLYSISRLGVNTKNSYSRINNTAINVNNCKYMNKMTSVNIFGEGDVCKNVFNSVGLKYLYVVNDVYNSLNDVSEYTIDYKDSAVVKTKKTVSIFDNGTIEYMKSLKKCYDSENIYNTKGADNKYTVKSISEGKNCTSPIKYMIGVFYRNDKYYYASIEL